MHNGDLRKTIFFMLHQQNQVSIYVLVNVNNLYIKKKKLKLESMTSMIFY